MDFAPTPRERDRDADYIVAFQASAYCSAWLSQPVGNIHHDSGNEPTHSDLGKGGVLRLCGCPCAMLLGDLQPVELSLLLRHRVARHRRGDLDRKSASCEHAGGGHHAAADAVGGRFSMPADCRRSYNRRHQLHARFKHLAVSKGALTISWLATLFPVMVALAIGLRPARVGHTVRGRDRRLAHFLSFRSGPATVCQSP